MNKILSDDDVLEKGDLIYYRNVKRPLVVDGLSGVRVSVFLELADIYDRIERPEKDGDERSQMMLVSEGVLSKDWNTPEEDAAWEHLDSDN